MGNKSWCESCGKEVECVVTKPSVSTFFMGDVECVALQKHTYCKTCGEEVYIRRANDWNIKRAYRAYLCALFDYHRFVELYDMVYLDIRNAVNKPIFWVKKFFTRGNWD